MTLAVQVVMKLGKAAENYTQWKVNASSTQSENSELQNIPVASLVMFTNAFVCTLSFVLYISFSPKLCTFTLGGVTSSKKSLSCFPLIKVKTLHRMCVN